MEFFAIFLILIPAMAIHYAMIPLRRRRYVPYSINAFLLKSVQQELDHATKTSTSLLTAEDVRNVLLDAKLRSKTEEKTSSDDQ